MFTIKFYTEDSLRCVIKSAESFTVLKHFTPGRIEITMHQKNGDGERVDLFDPRTGSSDDPPIRYSRAIIENAQGRTTEVLSAASLPN